MSLAEAANPYIRKNHATTDWNEERLALLLELNPQGTSSWIAGELNARTGSRFSRNAVIGKLLRIGVVKAITPGCYSRPGPRGPRKTTAVRRLPARQPVEPEHLGLSLTALENDRSQCRYPRGTENFTFCAQPVTEDSSYCEFHHALCCHPYEKKERAAA